jgi:hypothetical protein
MNRVVWVGLALFLLAMIGVPSARADSYKPAFTCNGNCSHSSVVRHDISFDLDGPGHRHAAHRMNRKGHKADFSGGNQGDNNDQGSNDQGQTDQGASNGQGSTAVPPTTGSGSDMGSGGTGSSGSMGSCGCSTSTTPPPTAAPTAATPEPSTVILMLLGTGLLFLTRKRFLPSVPNT